MLSPKKNSYKEFHNEKKFLRLENSPPPPHNFSNGPSVPYVIEMISFGAKCYNASYYYKELSSLKKEIHNNSSKVTEPKLESQERII